MLLLDGIVIGIAAGLIAGGSLRRLGHVHLRGESLMLVLLVLQLSIPSLAERYSWPKTPALALWLATMAGLVALALWNRDTPGMVFVGLGIALNVLVIGYHQGMPVSLEAVRWLNPSAEPVFDLLHVRLTERNVLAVLSDAIPIPGPPWHRGVASVGDFVLMFGAGLFMYSGMRTGVDRS